LEKRLLEKNIHYLERKKEIVKLKSFEKEILKGEKAFS